MARNWKAIDPETPVEVGADETTNAAKASDAPTPPDNPAKEVASENENVWRGRYESEVPALKAKAENADFLAPKILELQEKLKAAEALASEVQSEDFQSFKANKNKPKDEPLFSDDDRQRLVEHFGEEGAKLYETQQIRLFNQLSKQLEATTKPDTAAIEKANNAEAAALNASFLGNFDAETRQKITNENSELMKWASNQKDGRTSTKAKEIQAIISARDASQEALDYIANIKAEFEASKATRKASAPAGTPPNQLPNAATQQVTKTVIGNGVPRRVFTRIG